MQPTFTKRLNKEVLDVNATTKETCISIKQTDSVYHMIAVIDGPKGSPYENGVFTATIDIPYEYPFRSPIIKFTTKIFHCNIGQHGEICLDLLKDQWSPTLTLGKLLLAIKTLLFEPNPHDPLSPIVADLYRHNKQEHDKTAEEWTKMYAVNR